MTDWIKEARARCKAATPGRWVQKNYDSKMCNTLIACKDFIVAEAFGPRVGQAEVDAEFIAHARTNLPRALDAVESLMKENEALKAALEQIGYGTGPANHAVWIAREVLQKYWDKREEWD